MSSPVIRVENLSKRYTLGQRVSSALQYDTFRDALVRKIKEPFRRSSSNPESPSPDFWALKDVSFEIQQGEVVGIIGRNGAGKSTLLKILSRITEPTSGRIGIRGRLASLLEVGTGFHPELTGRENIFLNGVILGMTRSEVNKRFDEIVAFAEVEQFLDTPVKRYSSGMYVRLAFAVAAHLDPEILVVDEVLAVGDAQFQKKCLRKMNDACKEEGRTVLLVSHNSGALLNICRHGLWLDRGAVAHAGSISDCISRYTASGADHLVRFEGRKDRPHIEFVEIDPTELQNGHLHIRVGFRSPTPLSPPVLGVIVQTKFGQPVFGSNTRMTGDDWRPGAMSAGVFVARRNDVPLCNDTYKLSVWLGDGTQDFDSRLDALMFEFTSGLYHPQATSPDISGPLALSWNWEMVTA